MVAPYMLGEDVEAHVTKFYEFGRFKLGILGNGTVYIPHSASIFFGSVTGVGPITSCPIVFT